MMSDEAPQLTIEAHRCPACGTRHRMRVEWPIWVCRFCQVRLIPADEKPLPDYWLRRDDEAGQ
jgi:ribosomal protein L37AE/L43A